MLYLKNKLEIQDLIRELEENKLNYEVITTKTSDKGEITFLELRIVGKYNDKINN